MRSGDGCCGSNASCWRLLLEMRQTTRTRTGRSPLRCSSWATLTPTVTQMAAVQNRTHMRVAAAAGPQAVEGLSRLCSSQRGRGRLQWCLVLPEMGSSRYVLRSK